MYEQSVHSRNLLKFVEIYMVNYCIINCCESFVIKLLWEFCDKVVVRVCWMSVVNNHLNKLLKIYHLIMMKMWWRCNEWSITNSPIVNVCAEVLIKKCIIVCWNECLLGRFSKIFVECLRWIIHHSICCEECFVRVRWMFVEDVMKKCWSMLLKICYYNCCESLLKCVLEVVVMKWSCDEFVE